MVEIAEGERISGDDGLIVTSLGKLEEVAFAEIRARPGKIVRAPQGHPGDARAFYVFDGELTLRLDGGEHRVGPNTWVFVPPGVEHTLVVTGEDARVLDVRVPSRGGGADADPTIVRAGGAEGETISDRPNRRATLLVDADELTVTEFAYGSGERGAKLHVHHEHADGFLVVEGEFAFHNREGTLSAREKTLVLFPPNVAHGFDNDSDETARCFNFHMPASGFADYLRGRNPDFDQHDPPADGGVDPAAIVAVRLAE